MPHLTRKNIWKYLTVAGVAVFIGIGSAILVIHHPPVKTGITIGPWMTHPDIGSPDAGIYLRAYIAKHALFALNRKETIYFIAHTDDNGEPLRSTCSYRVEGKDLNTRWWAITLYGDDEFLIPNEQKRYAFNANDVIRDEDGYYRIYISPQRRGLNWIPSGEKEQPISLTLRLYNPAYSVYEKIESLELPSIVQEGCQ